MLLGSRQAFADVIAAQDQLWRLLNVLHEQDDIESENSANNLISHKITDTKDLLANDNDNEHQSTFHYMRRRRREWDVLEALAANSSIAKTILRSSAWLELLGIIVGYSQFTKLMVARLGAAKVLSKLLWDPENGPVLGELVTACIILYFLKL